MFVCIKNFCFALVLMKYTCLNSVSTLQTSQLLSAMVDLLILPVSCPGVQKTEMC